MSNFEQYIVWGNLGSDPETRTLDGGNTVCKFRLAVNRRYKDNEYTTWFNVDAWGKLGELCQKYLSKGSNALVIADRLEAQAYESSDGELRASVQITAKDVRFGPSGSQKEEKDEIPW